MWTKIEHTTIEELEKHFKEYELSGTELMLLLTISRFGWGQDGKRNPCTKSPANLAEMLGRSTRQIKRSMEKLKAHGFIDIIYRTQCGGTTKTTINKDTAWKRLQKERPLSVQTMLKEPGIGTNIKVKN